MWVDGRIVEQCACGGEEKCTGGFDGEPEGKRPFGRPRVGREHIAKVDLEEMCTEYVSWIHLAQNIDK